MDFRLSLSIVITVAIWAGVESQSAFDSSSCETLSPIPIPGLDLVAGANSDFLVIASPSSYDPDVREPVRVFLVGIGGPTSFSSYIIQARRVDNGCAVGNFVLPNADEFDHIRCGTFASSSVLTRQQDRLFSLPFTITWTPPAQSFGSVEFYITIIGSDGLLYQNLMPSFPLTATEPLAVLEVSCTTAASSVTVDGNIVTYEAPICMRGSRTPQTAVCEPESETAFAFGITTVTCLCEHCLDTAECQFNVFVEDTGPPPLCGPCTFGECTLSQSSAAGYTCHTEVGQPCLN